MTDLHSANWQGAAISVIAAGIGGAAAGPLGAALGGWLGDSISKPAAKLIEEFGEKASDKIAEIVGDFLSERARDSPEDSDGNGPSPQLESVVREALRRGLTDIRPQVLAYGDWFVNWEIGLSAQQPLDLLDVVQDQFAPGKLSLIDPTSTVSALNGLFCRVMERLDGEGAALKRTTLSITPPFRTMPPELFAQLAARLPGPLQAHFRRLISETGNDRAWKEGELRFRDHLATLVARVAVTTDRIDDKTDRILEILESRLVQAETEGRMAKHGLETAHADLKKLAEAYRKLQRQVAARAPDPGDADLFKLLATGDLDGALRLKTQMVERRRGEAEKLARDLFEVGIIQEFRFDWPKALDAYREAWQHKREFEYGVKYAYFAQRQNHLRESLAVYEDLRNASVDLAETAWVLNRLGDLHRALQQTKEAEQAYKKALNIYLYEIHDKANHLPQVLTTLNNLAGFYLAIKRVKEAEEISKEALAVYLVLSEDNGTTYLPELLAIMHILALTYSETDRGPEADQAFEKILDIFRLEAADPKSFSSLSKIAVSLEDLATTRNNQGALHMQYRRIAEAEGAFQAALTLNRLLAEANPEAYIPHVASTLGHLALLRVETQRATEAVPYADEALETLGPFWTKQPEAHGDLMARLLLLRAGASDSYKDACEFSRFAFDAAYDQDLKQAAQKLIDSFCGKG